MSDSSKLSEQPLAEEHNTRHPRIYSWIFKFGVELPAGILVILITIILMATLTEFGRTLSTNIALKLVKLPAGFTLTMTDLKSPSIGEWQFSSLTLKQNNNVITHIESAVIDWNPLEILRGEIHFNRFSVEKINFHQTNLQLPTGAEKEDVADHEESSLVDKLNALDNRINTELRKLSLKLMPITLSQFSIDELNVITETSLITFKNNGELNFGTKNNVVDLTLNTSIQTRDIPVPIEFLTKIKMDYAKEVSINISSSHLKDDLLPFDITGEMNARIDLVSKPLIVRLLPSLWTINEVPVQLKGSVSYTEESVKIEDFIITTLDGLFQINGLANQNTLDINTTIFQIDTSAFIPMADKMIVNGDLHITGNPFNPTVMGGFTASGNIDSEAAFMSTDIQADRNKAEFTNTLVRLGDASATAQGQYQMSEKKITIQGHPKNLEFRQLTQFRVPIPKQVDLVINDAVTDIQIVLPSPDKPLQLDLNSKGQFAGTIFSIPAIIDGNISLDLDKINIKNADIKMNDALVNAEGEIHWKNTTIDLKLNSDKITPESISWLPIAIPQQIQSQLKAEVNINGHLLEPDIAVLASGPLSYDDLTLRTRCNLVTDLKQLKINKCDFFAPQNNTPMLMSHTGVIKFKPLDIKLKHTFNLFPVGLLTKAFPETHQIRNSFELEGKLHGQVQSHIDMTTAPTGEKKPGLNHVNADIAFFGSAWSKSLFGGLRANARDTQDGLEINLQSLGLDYGDNSHFTMKAKLSPEMMDMKIVGSITSDDLKTLPVAGLETITQWPGHIRLETEASGSMKQPSIKGTFEYGAQIQQLNSSGTHEEVPLKLVAAFKSPEMESLKIAAEIFKKNKRQSEFELETNALSRLLNTLITRETPPPLLVRSKGQMNLDNLNLLLSPVFHQFQGLAFWDWQFENNFQGFLEINQGLYQHLTLGTTFKNVQLLLHFDESGVSIEKGLATDGHKGQYELDGFFNIQEFGAIKKKLEEASPNTVPINALSPASSLENLDPNTKKTNINLRMNNVRLVDRPEIESLAQGQVTFLREDSTQAPYQLQGEVQLQPLEIQLDRTQSDSVPEIDIIKYNPRFQTGAQESDQQVPIGLKIDLKTDQQAFLRGKGINAELAGNISVRGTSSNPEFSGFFNTLRGDADILGKRFVIDTGELRFDGYRGLINIEATHRKVNQTFTAYVTGSLENLDVRLESTPPLPEDETFSQLLFGKSLDDITAMQALRIAAAVRSFSSGGGGLDPLATTRDILGVDQVTLDSENTDEGDENYKLGVGKYISEKVYVEIQRSTDPTEPWQGQVQIELTPNISLKTGAESTSGFSGIDLNWKRDY